MTENATPEKPDEAPDGRLQSLMAAVGGVAARGPAPVHLWNPPFCGDIALRIAADGTWFYEGTPITRRPLVELFGRILRRDPERYVLVTPAECVGITVEDVPFLAVAMVADAAADGGCLRFATNVGDEVAAGREHPLRFDAAADGGIRPYVHVRGGLWARLTRSLAIDLIDRAAEETVDGRATLGVRSGAAFFPLAGGDAP